MINFVAEEKDGRMVIGFVMEEEDIHELLHHKHQYMTSLDDLGVKGYDIMIMREDEETFLHNVDKAGVPIYRIDDEQEMQDIMQAIRETKSGE